MKTLISIIIMGMTLSLFGQDKGMQEAATKALGELKALAAMKDINMPNVPSIEVLNTARLGDMMPQFMIRLDRLQKYSTTEAPKSLIEKTSRVTFPVVGPETEVISSVEVDHVDNVWRTADLNNVAYVKAFDLVRKELGLLTSQCTLIRVPAFNLYFLGREGLNGMEMAYLGEKAFNDIPAKRFVPAAQVLTQLSAVAKNYNGLPW
jgi:hypothetical protein